MLNIVNQAINYVNLGNISLAKKIVQDALSHNTYSFPEDVNLKFLYSQLLKDGTIVGLSQSRDVVLKIIDDYPVLLTIKNDEHVVNILRYAASVCSVLHPIEKSIFIYKHLISFTESADDFFALAELLSKTDDIDDAIFYLKKSIALDPEKYDTEENRHTLSLVSKKNKKVKKIGRYPSNEEFKNGNLSELIKSKIAVDLNNIEKIITKDSKIFTMGSCFARNISRSLSQKGYNAHHLEITEHVNTTFANKMFVDWLQNREISSQVSSRFSELLPKNWDRTTTLKTLSNLDLFILTLGVAPAFFDASTGDYVLPRSSSLNSRALAEKYLYRNTTVSENVKNVLEVISYIRSISPDCKIIVTVSPVPLMASFNFESCVVADCLSKSTMRLVADEVVNHKDLKSIYYWPSFEIFRWAGSNASDFFGKDDGSSSHVTEEKVDATINAFLDIFSS